MGGELGRRLPGSRIHTIFYIFIVGLPVEDNPTVRRLISLKTFRGLRFIPRINAKEGVSGFSECSKFVEFSFLEAHAR